MDARWWWPYKNEGLDKSDSISWHHINHEILINFLKKTEKVQAKINFSGKCIQENFNNRRIFIGKVSVDKIHELFKTHGDKILEKNIRKFLGIHKSRVNEEIQKTLISNKKENFYFLNNGITIICEQFSHNEFQKEDVTVNLKDIQNLFIIFALYSKKNN